MSAEIPTAQSDAHTTADRGVRRQVHGARHTRSFAELLERVAYHLLDPLDVRHGGLVGVESDEQ